MQPKYIETGLCGVALPVDLSPVANVYHQDQETFVVYLIEDAIITDANSPGISAAELFDAMGSGLFGKAADGIRNPLPILYGDT